MSDLNERPLHSLLKPRQRWLFGIFAVGLVYLLLAHVSNLSSFVSSDEWTSANWFVGGHIGFPAQPTNPLPKSPELNTSALQDLVSRTKGFLARDYNLELGWNNMRYIIEASLLQAQLLNRTLILPSYVYARSCEYEIRVCAKYAQMVNRGDAVHSDEWRGLPVSQQMAWKIPIELMMNITHLRRTNPVLTVSDYLRLHDQDPTTEANDGVWRHDRYNSHPNVVTGKIPSLATIANSRYDPSNIVRVDEITQDLERARTNVVIEDPAIERALYVVLPKGKLVLDWEAAQFALDIWSDISLEEAVVNNGWAVLYTYTSVGGMDLNKGVAKPTRQIAPLYALRGFKNDYHSLNSTVVHLQGALHMGRKPGSMSFTTRASQDAYTNIVLYHIRRIDALQSLAGRIIRQMFGLNDGRNWMAAHVRRGDFVRYQWTMEPAPEGHIRRVKRRLEDGRKVLTRLSDRILKTYDVPSHLTPDGSLHTLEPPLPDDRFFIATDERDPAVLSVFRGAGAVTMDELLSIEDRRLLGKQGQGSEENAWALVFTDVRAVVEQIVLSEAGYFYGHAMSSIPGGVINLRAGLGKDPRTALVD